MRTLLAFVLGNWPLKLGAVALATVLYGGIVLSQNTRTWPGQVPIDIRNPPRDAAVLEFLGSVSNIQFRAPLDVASGLTNGSFGASIDLTNAHPTADGSPLSVPVTLTAIDRSVEIVDYQPKVVRVTLDPIENQTRPVTVDEGQVPEALRVGPPQVTPASVTIVGARSRVSTVQKVSARVTIDATGLNVDQEVDLLALDSNGAPVAGVQVEPRRARVRIDVAHDLANTQLPVRVAVTGTPAQGYEITSVTVSPLVVTVSGEAPVIQRLAGMTTLPVDVSGRDASFSTDIALDVPTDVTIEGSTTVHVQLGIAVAQASRSFEVATSLADNRADAIYTIQRPSVLVTLSGPATLLDRVNAADLRAVLHVGALAVGTHQVVADVTPPVGLQIQSVSPAAVQVDVADIPRPSAEPSASPSPTADASPSP